MHEQLHTTIDYAKLIEEQSKQVNYITTSTKVVDHIRNGKKNTISNQSMYKHGKCLVKKMK